ncbi:MAG: AAA family ATPase [Succinivibrionaceae bacterium]|nr:AAA family ATPase [Succinivibrionaceae bacterium]
MASFATANAELPSEGEPLDPGQGGALTGGQPANDPVSSAPSAPAQPGSPCPLDQVRLKSISVCNWGTFDGLYTVDIDPEGTMITGDNGAGKSTLVDGLMTLLIPPGKVVYNAAAAQDLKKDRTLMSYVRGSYSNIMVDDTQVAQNLRANSVISAVKARYEFDASHRQVALCGIFYVQGRSTASEDLRKLFIITHEDFGLKDLLQRFGNFDTRGLKAYVRSLPGGHACDSFSEYETYFRQQFRMDNAHATALLSRALGIKRVDDLTSLVRNLVLERGSLTEMASEMISGFADLKAIHERLVDLQEQERHLSRLPGLAREHQEKSGLIGQYQESFDAVTPFAARYGLSHYEGQLRVAEGELEQNQRQIDGARGQKQVAERERDTHRINYTQQGGDRTALLEMELQNARAELKKRSEWLASYQRQAQGFGLPQVTCREGFEQNREALSKLLGRNTEALGEADAVIGQKSAQQASLRDSLARLDADLAALARRQDSNVSAPYLKFRSQLAADLKIPEERLVYVAEMLEVRDGEGQWRGAIERALGGMRQTLLISAADERLITAYVNGRHNEGLNIRLRTVDGSAGEAHFGNRGFLMKLRFKDHPYQGYLRKLLERHDLQCVDDVEELRRTEHSMTKEGLIHHQRGFFQKNDSLRVDDRRHWCLGFSNREKVALLAGDRASLKGQIDELGAQLGELNAQRQGLRDAEHGLKSLLERFQDFAALDVNFVAAEIERVQGTIAELNANPTLMRLRQLLEESERQVQEIDATLMELSRRHGALVNDVENLKARIAECQRLISLREVSPECERIITGEMQRLRIGKDQVFEQGCGELLRKSIEAGRVRLEEARDTLMRSIISTITSFHSRWESRCTDFGTGFDSCPDYLRCLEQIRHDDLPRQLGKFKERISSSGTNAIAALNSRMDTELSVIDQRIEAINKVLARAEFGVNSYLRIKTQRISNVHIADFGKKVRRVLSLIHNEDHEGRYQAIAAVIDTLEGIIGTERKDLRAILDTRYRVQFLAEEIDRDSGEVRDAMTSSSGKSGGEKESFAGSVLAASLAYVLAPDRGSYPCYCTVFLDEAFSATAEGGSGRVMRIFRELNLHANLITPFKNIELGRDFTRSLLIFSKDHKTHRSSVCQISWEEYDRIQRQYRESLDAGEEVQVLGDEGPEEGGPGLTEGM